MTIFRKIAEEFLMEGIDKIQVTAKSFDNGLLNFLASLTLFGGRNLVLSDKKRERLNRLKDDIKALPESATDTVTKDALCTLITNCTHDLFALCKLHDNRSGTTESKLADLNAFVTAAYQKIHVDLNLQNVPANKTTTNTLKYYAGKTFGRSVYQKVFIQSADVFVLNGDKEAIILKLIERAVRIKESAYIARDKSALVMNKEDVIALMIDTAESIQRAVQTIDQEESNQYVIEYMKQAIDFFRPPAPKPEVTQAPIVEEQKKDEEAPSANPIQEDVVSSSSLTRA